MEFLAPVPVRVPMGEVVGLLVLGLACYGWGGGGGRLKVVVFIVLFVGSSLCSDLRLRQRIQRRRRAPA